MEKPSKCSTDTEKQPTTFLIVRQAIWYTYYRIFFHLGQD